MDDSLPLTSDCARCAALCCVAPAFDLSPDFACDKAANTPCRHLRQDNLCAIHDRLSEEGFRGCVAYECHGAGQRVVQDMFGGRSWRDDAALLGPMSEAFLAMRKVHDLLVLLRAAGQATLAAEERAALDGLWRELNPVPGWTVDRLRAFEAGDLPRRVEGFLASLAHHFRNSR